MAERVTFSSLTEREFVDRLRVHGRLQTAYALAMARRAGLGASEAAELFISPLVPVSAPLDRANDPEALRHWLEIEAAGMEAVHGRVRLERHEHCWRLTLSVAEDVAALRTWDVPPEYWVEWLTSHVEWVSFRHQASVSVVLRDGELVLTFAPEARN